MIRTRVIPCLLLRSGRLVKTVRFSDPKYVGDPVNAIKIYNEKEVDEIIVLDISATPAERAPDFKLISELTDECFMPMCYGGGIRSLDDARRLFATGIEKVALNTHAAEQPALVEQIAGVFGSQAVVASIDAKRGLLGRYGVRTRGGTVDLKRTAVDHAKQMVNAGAGEILLTSIDRDGTWKGYDLELVQGVTEAVRVPVIASGGAGSTAHFVEVVRRAGASAVATGSMVVYQAEGLGVLINFPTRTELEGLP